MCRPDAVRVDDDPVGEEVLQPRLVRIMVRVRVRVRVGVRVRCWG